LEKLGFIHREPDTEDRRMIVVSLTPSGEALRPEIVAAVGEACQAMTATLEPDEAALFRRLLAKAVAGVEVSAN
jgi:DNA-binding MarR family transcriptional regulator